MNEEPIKTGKIGVLKSQLKISKMISYDGEGMKIAGRSTSSILEFDKLGPLPDGIKFVERRRE